MGSILLVDADPEAREQLATAMRAAGHEVLLASTKREAFLRISEGGIDAVVVDSYEPHLGLIELSHSMNALPDAPPVVLVSASPRAPEVSARIGAAAFLPKPCEPAEVVAAVARIVGEVRPTREIVDDFAHEDETGPTTVRQLG